MDKINTSKYERTTDENGDTKFVLKKGDIEEFTIPDGYAKKIVDSISEFYKSKGKSNPEGDAILVLNRCLKGTTRDGSPWKTAPKSLDGRLKKFGFDINAMKMDESLFDYPGKQSNEDKEDEDEALSGLSRSEKIQFNRFTKQFLDDFPQLDNIADLKILELLIFKIIYMERINKKAMLVNGGKSPAGFHTIPREISELQEILGISGKQRKGEREEREKSSLADLVVRFEETAKKAPEMEDRYMKEEIALLLRKMDRTGPDGTPEVSKEYFEHYMKISVDEARKIVVDPYSKEWKPCFF